MAYNETIPQPTTAVSNAQAALLENFAVIKTLIAEDHNTFSTANEGMHKKITFPVQATAGAVVAGQIGLYADTSGGTEELFINRVAGQIPFTKSVKEYSGYTYLPSGIIMQWGFADITTAGVNVPFAIPFPTKCLNVNLSVNTNAANNWFVMAQFADPGKTFFTGYATTRTGGATTAAIHFMAIGY